MDSNDGIRVERCAREQCQVLVWDLSALLPRPGVLRPAVARRQHARSRSGGRGHQASPEGRLDHRDREQDRDREAELARVTDHSL